MSDDERGVRRTRGLYALFRLEDSIAWTFLSFLFQIPPERRPADAQLLGRGALVALVVRQGFLYDIPVDLLQGTVNIQGRRQIGLRAGADDRPLLIQQNRH